MIMMASNSKALSLSLSEFSGSKTKMIWLEKKMTAKKKIKMRKRKIRNCKKKTLSNTLKI